MRKIFSACLETYLWTFFKKLFFISNNNSKVKMNILLLLNDYFREMEAKERQEIGQNL
jgi:hypothetical protein